MSVDSMHSLFKTGERFLKLTHQLLNPPFQMQAAVLDELLADPDARLSALLNAILDGIVALESEAALDEEQTTGTMPRGDVFTNPALPLVRRADTTPADIAPLPAPFRPVYPKDSQSNSPAQAPDNLPALSLSPGLLRTMADLNIPLPGITQARGILTSTDVNWSSTRVPEHHGRFTESDVPDMEHPAAGQSARGMPSQAGTRLSPAAGIQQTGSKLPTLPQNLAGKVNDPDAQFRAPTGDVYGQSNNVAAQTGWQTADEFSAPGVETTAPLPDMASDLQPLSSRSVSGAAKIASVLRANLTNPPIAQQARAMSEFMDDVESNFGAEGIEKWAQRAQPASPLQIHSPIEANIGEESVRQESKPDRTNGKVHDEVDLEKLVEQLADYLEFEFQRTYGTSGGAL